MADKKFAEKTTNFSPLTKVARAFSPSTFATPDFKQGKVVLSSFRFPESGRLSEFGPSYTGAVNPPESEEGEE